MNALNLLAPLARRGPKARGRQNPSGPSGPSGCKAQLAQLAQPPRVSSNISYTKVLRTAKEQVLGQTGGASRTAVGLLVWRAIPAPCWLAGQEALKRGCQPDLNQQRAFVSKHLASCHRHGLLTRSLPGFQGTSGQVSDRKPQRFLQGPHNEGLKQLGHRAHIKDLRKRRLGNLEPTAKVTKLAPIAGRASLKVGDLPTNSPSRAESDESWSCAGAVID